MTQPFTPDPPPERRTTFLGRLRANFLAGLVVIAPIGLTIWLIWTVIGWVDGFVLPLIPDGYQPDILLRRWLGPEVDVDDRASIRGVGVIVFLLFTIIIGWMAKGLIGRSIIRSAERLVQRTPVVRSIYNGVKQIAETVFAQTESSFEKACLIEYPRRGIWAVGFISTTTKGEVRAKAGGYEMTSVFVPTTPNPTSGFLLFLPTEDVVELDMSVEDAAKLVISAGLVYPNGDRELLDPVPASG
ncbi:DUF502 domain-containing protein [Aestuariibius insulae]|uniref:DUF502 domain-containing protein n=1 Tax=Aestuariibius insulae TaxID=2058287 RepID=UPI00345E0E04